MSDYAGMREPYAFIQHAWTAFLHNVERIRSIDDMVAPLTRETTFLLCILTLSPLSFTCDAFPMPLSSTT